MKELQPGQALLYGPTFCRFMQTLGKESCLEGSRWIAASIGKEKERRRKSGEDETLLLCW